MYYKLQSLRGIAACLLVLYKSPYYLFEHKTAFMFNTYLFVDLFFVLSGFVIMHAYGKRISQGLGFGRFVFLRLGRIYPIHFLMLLVFVAYELLKSVALSSAHMEGTEQHGKDLYSFITNIFLAQSLHLHHSLSWNTPSWSISVEFYAYIIFYLLFVTLDKKEGVVVPIVLITVCYAALYFMGKESLNVTYDFGILRALAGFYLGVLAFRLKPVLAKLPLEGTVAELVCLTGIVVCVCYAGLGWPLQLGAVAFFFISMEVFSRDKNGWVGRFLDGGFMRNIGEWSFSIYMIHMFIWTIVNMALLRVLKLELEQLFGLTSIAIDAAVLLVTIVLSRFTYVYIENTCRNWSKSWIAKRS